MLPARSLLAPLAAAAALAPAACGGGGGVSASAQTGAGPAPGALTFAKCMRGHGVPQFPDPGGGPRSASSISILGAHLPANTNIHAPTFQAALNLCMKRLLAGHPRPPVSAAQKASVLKAARCMRANGVPNFPDPKFPPGGGIGIETPPGVTPSSPAFQHASKVCGGP
jgi:hypothetical protein